MKSLVMQIRPIKTEEDHDAALTRISELMGAEFGSPEGDELDALATLVAAYEEKHHPIDAPDPASAILFRMEQQNLTRTDLEPLIGTRARVSEILAGKRNLTIPMIQRVRSELGISADFLIAKSSSGRDVRGRNTRAKKTASKSPTRKASEKRA